MRGCPRCAAQRPLPSMMIATCRGSRSQAIDDSKRSSRVPLLTTSAKSASTLFIGNRLRTLFLRALSFLLLRHTLSIVLHALERQAVGGGGWPSQFAIAFADCAGD